MIQRSVLFSSPFFSEQSSNVVKIFSYVSRHIFVRLKMTDNDYELLQHCIDTDEFVTTKTAHHYLLFHEHILNSQLDLGKNSRFAITFSLVFLFRLESPNAFIRKLFQSNGLSIEDAQITSHVHPSVYGMIIFADRSIVYTPSKTFADSSKKCLPYYVPEDLEFLRKTGMSANDIDLFVEKLNGKEYPNLGKYDRIIQNILDWTDLPTRLKLVGCEKEIIEC